MFDIRKINDFKLKDPVLIEGLPGIGNVGKLAVDFIVDELKPTLLYEIYSHEFPHSVLVNEDDTISLPAIRIYGVKKGSGRDLLLLSGDVQPTTEKSSYVFAEEIVILAEQLGCKEIVTLGGVGWPQEPEKSLLYCIGNDAGVVKDFKGRLGKFAFQNSNRISNIVGAAGLLLGMAKRKNIRAVSFLVDTFSHPMHLGITEGKQLATVLKELYNIEIDLSKIDKEKKIKLPKSVKMKPEQRNISYIG